MVNNPITPPPELVQEWMTEFYGTPIAPGGACAVIVTRSAQWGADQELEACLRYLYVKGHHPTLLNALRAARRPEPLSLKKQALDELVAAERLYPADWSTIRLAIEALPE